MTKKLMLITCFLAMYITSSAQGTSLTKEETINYINKKMQETVGHYKTNKQLNGSIGDKNYYWIHNISLYGDKVKVTRTRSNYTKSEISEMGYVYVGGTSSKFVPCDYYEDELVQEFNPIHISSIEFLKDPVSGEPIGSMQLNLKANTAQSKASYTSAKYKFDSSENVRYEYWDKCHGSQTPSTNPESTNKIYINYLAADEDNFDKLKKAFEYLRDLYKAEDDPFG